jgi:cytochrome c oxidase subunit 4
MLALMLADGAKEFFEKPEFLLGIPLLVAGVLGLVLVMTPADIRWPERTAFERGPLLPEETGHPNARVYVQVGMVLAIVTAVEVALYYIDMASGALLGLLIVLSMLKFLLVVLWFMHLRFDNRIFSILFFGGMGLAFAIFVAVLAMMGANLV